MIVNNSTEAFEKLCHLILKDGIKRESSKGTWWSIFNVGIEILNPADNIITTPWRKFSLEYCKAEMQWYLSKDRSASFIEQYASLWSKLKDSEGNLNSNYGALMWEKNQWELAKKRLMQDSVSRQSIITLYDGKKFLGSDSKDIPCTLNLGFRIVNSKLNMSVLMRSNDAVKGFCVDQWIFSEFQKMMASEIGIQVGTYHHFAMDMHLYEKDFIKVKQHLSI